MKKIQYILLASLVIGAGASAASLPEEAAAMAEQFLSQKMGGKTADGGSLTAAVMSTSDKAVKKTKSLKKAEFYAYNAPQGGFVLMSANGDDLRVMGYSTDAGLSFDNMPEALQEWMVAYKAATASSDFSNSYPTPTVAPVAPLLKTKWGQGAPFNRKCPKYNGNPMLTGCTATAMAQILNYYKSNSKGYDVLEYVNEGVGNKEISVDFTKISYDWANMLDVYEEGSYTDAQADAVAQLMYEAGVSCKAKYDVTWSGSGATSAAIPYVGFNRYYDYNCEIWVREYVPTKLWMTVIQEELTAGRPILYSGYNGASGHAFVIDGIDAENNVHINWGWSGDADGYYDVTYCKAPDETRGYYCQQQMLVGLRPRTAADAPYAEGIKLIGFNQGNSYGTVTTNYYESDKSYTFTIGLMQNGVTKYIRKDYEYDKLGCYPYMNSGKEYGDWTDAAGNENPTFADGDYELTLYYKERDTENPWTALPAREGMRTIMNINGGEWTCTAPMLEKYSVQSGKILSIEPAAELIGKAPLYLTVAVQDDSHRLPGVKRALGFTFTDTETGAVYEAGRSIYAFDGYYSDILEQKTFCISATNEKGFMLPGGTYKVGVKNDNSSEYTYAEEFQIDVKPAVDYPILDSAKDLYSEKSTTYYWGSKVWLWNRAARNSVNKMDGNVNMSVYAKSVETGEEVRLCTFADVPVPSDDKYYFYVPNSLYPLEGAYELSMRYATPDGERGLLNPDAERQIITILPTEYANIPKIAATETQLPNSEYLPKGEQQTLNVPMTNTATADFKGAVKASFYCEKSGKYIEVEIPDVTIKAGESATVAVPVTFPENGVYTMQMNATSQQSVAAEKVGTTYVTAPNGSPLGYRIGVGESSVSAVKGVSLRVYPNPATESFRILGLEEASGVTVMSATGAVVVSTTADKDQSIDVSGLPTGVYFVKAGQNVLKFVKR